jgi:hypothetical protein
MCCGFVGAANVPAGLQCHGLPTAVGDPSAPAHSPTFRRNQAEFLKLLSLLDWMQIKRLRWRIVHICMDSERYSALPISALLTEWRLSQTPTGTHSLPCRLGPLIYTRSSSDRSLTARRLHNVECTSQPAISWGAEVGSSSRADGSNVCHLSLQDLVWVHADFPH